MSTIEDKTTLRAEASIASQMPRNAHLVMYHSDGAKVVPLYYDSSVVIGRAFPSDVVLHTLSLSRQHARLSWNESGFSVEDLGSTNKTYCNGKAIYKKTQIQPGDEIQLGEIILVLHTPGQHSNLSGIDSFEKCMRNLEQEIFRARTFSRTVSLLILEVSKSTKHHKNTIDLSFFHSWVSHITPRLRPVDRVGMYSSSSILITLPEMNEAQTQLWVESLLSDFQQDSKKIQFGIAVFPEQATSAEELLSVTRQRFQSPTHASSTLEQHKTSTIITSKSTKELWALVDQIASSALPVLIQGETGVGKEVVARVVHEKSSRKSKIFRAINCAALPPTLLESTLFGHERGAFTGADRVSRGLFEQAHEGTLFLDEIGELSPAAQASLLRVLETKTIVKIGSDKEIPIDVRVVAATHRNLESMCSSGTFRWDLFYRLNTVTLFIPPLRDRKEEIKPFVQRFLYEANRTNQRQVQQLSADAYQALERYPWPGNVRELRNAIERAVVIAHGSIIQVTELPERIQNNAPTLEISNEAVWIQEPIGTATDYKSRVHSHMQAYETELICKALQACKGNQTEAAKLLQLPLRTLAHKIQTYNIKKEYKG